MRNKIILFCLLFCGFSATAKDVITKKDGSKLDAKVEEITESIIKYRKLSNPTGPIYTIPTSSVLSIVYENGTLDSFSSATEINSSPNFSDDELIKQSEQPQQNVVMEEISDSQLLKLYGIGIDNQISKQISKYKKTGWIGGGVIFGAGIVAGLALWGSWGWDGGDIGAPMGIMGGALAGAAIWSTCFHIKANSIQKGARINGLYSMSLLEKEFNMNGGNSLTAGINIIGDRFSDDNAFGLSLKLSF